MRSSVLASGFRLGFLLSGWRRCCWCPLAAVQVFGAPLVDGWPPMLHAHEMLYGFIAAAIAGFLLTAVPSWTARRGFGGAPLALLGALWLADACWPRAPRPGPRTRGRRRPGLLLALVVLFAPLLLRERNRNTPCCWSCWRSRPATWRSTARSRAHDPPAAGQALRIAIDIVALLVTIVAGRIVPAFTASRCAKPARRPACAAALASARRRSSPCWRCWRTSSGRGAAWRRCSRPSRRCCRRCGSRSGGWRALHEPLVWVLQAAYAWLPIGLALKSVALLWGLAFSAFWLHALTVGAMATMILGVMSRTALSHTGRPMRVGTLSTAAYLLLLAAALTRVFGIVVPGLDYVTVIVLARSGAPPSRCSSSSTARCSGGRASTDAG
ncbi:MAG: NnrS family protein [Steroidobacteraceae bacterium]